MAQPSMRCRLLVLVAATAASLMLWSASASAEAYLINANTYFQNTASGLVTGNVKAGYAFALDRSSSDGAYAYGRIFDNAGWQKCGWIKYSNANLTDIGPGTGNCGTIGDVGDYYNSFSRSGVTDGRYFGTKVCPAYLNISSYGSGNGVGATTTSGSALYYRYTTNDGQYMMVRDSGRSGNNWLFVPTTCLSRPPSTYKEFYSYRSFQATVNGKWVSAIGGGGDGCWLFANATTPSTWESFRTNDGAPFNDGTILNLQVWNGQWIGAIYGGGSGFHCDAAVPSTWETFQPVKLTSNGTSVIGDGDLFAIRTYDGAHYWSAEDSGNSALDATRTAIGSWETFRMTSTVPPNTPYNGYP